MIRRAAALLAPLLLSTVALAAQVTHVATADSPDWPVEVDLYAGFQYTSENANIAREEFKQSGGLELGTEMGYQRNTMMMPIRAAVGIWHHLELHLLLPIVLDDKQSWGYVPNVSSESGGGTTGPVTVDKTPALCPEGPPNAAGLCANGAPPAPIIPTNSLPTTSNRGGFVLGNIVLGLAWAPLSEEDDDTDPTWVVGFDYAAPSASVMNPTQVSSGSPESAVGDGFNHFQPWTALSKRHGIFDPYVEVYADLPVASGDVYNNCVVSLSAEEAGASATPYYGNTKDPRINCNSPSWPTSSTQATPVYLGGFWFGSEFVATEDKEKAQKVAVDVRFITEYHSEARTYTEVSDLFEALTYQQGFARLGAQIGLNLRPNKYFQVLINGGLAHDTDHWLTLENLGTPAAGSTAVQVGSNQQNPSFDFRYDNPGDRFMLQNSLIWSFTGTLMASF